MYHTRNDSAIIFSPFEDLEDRQKAFLRLLLEMCAWQLKAGLRIDPNSGFGMYKFRRIITETTGRPPTLTATPSIRLFQLPRYGHPLRSGVPATPSFALQSFLKGMIFGSETRCRARNPRSWLRAFSHPATRRGV
jgi:hypothetical protein